MRGHPANPRVFRCKDRIRHTVRRTQNIANVVIDLRQSLADVGKPFALVKRQQRIALRCLKGPRRGDKLARAKKLVRNRARY